MKRLKRIQDLIELLLLRRDDYIPTQVFADSLQVSKRTIFNDLSSHLFTAIVGKNAIDRKQNLGIRLIADERSLEAIQSRLNDASLHANAIDFENDTIAVEILLMLFTHKHAITYDALGRQLFLSRTPLLIELNKVSKWLGSLDITLERKENEGIQLQANESKIRRAFKEFCMHYLNNSAAEIRGSRIFETLHQTLQHVFGHDFIKKVCDVLDLAEIHLNDFFTDFDYSTMVTKIAILVFRSSLGKPIVPRNHFNSRTREYLIAQVIKTHIDNSFNVSLSSYEVQELTRHLLSTRQQRSNIRVGDYLNDPESITDLIATISSRLDLDLSMDAELIKNLSSHLNLASRRFRYGIKIENPILNRIRIEYPDVYLAIMTSIEVFEHSENLALDENEIGYICLHVVASINRNKRGRHLKTLLICDSGRAFSSYIRSEIETNFSEIDIVDEIGVLDLSHTNQNKYDLIISTSDLPDMDTEHTLLVNRILTNSDYDSIRTWLLKHETNLLTVNHEEMKERLLVYQDSITTMDALLKKYCDILLELAYVTEGYYESVLKREAIASTNMGKGIAAPHGSSNFVNKSVVAIIHLDQQLDWNGTFVDLVFLIAINTDNNNHQLFFKNLFQIISNDEKILQIKNSTNSHDLKELFYP